MVSAKKARSAKSSWPPSDEVFERSIARVKAMTPAEFRQSMVDAGILTKKGNYTKPYRILGQSVSRAPRAAAAR